MKKEPDIRNEEIFLLGLCRTEFSAELKIMLLALAEVVTDWNYFAMLSNSHGVAALSYDNMERLDFIKYLPEKARDFLRNASLMSLTRNTKHALMLQEALEVLNRENIKTVLLKGMALELTVYGNRGLRQMSDIDVLVDKNDIMRGYRALISHGFVSLEPKSVLHKLILRHIGKHLPSLIKDGLSLELHHELFGSDRNTFTKLLFDTCAETEVSGKKARVPRPQIFFLYLLKHLYSHEMNNESQLRLYTDLVVLIEKYRNDIINENLLILAKDAGMTELLAHKMEPVRDLMGVSFPEWLNAFIDKWYNPDSINKFIYFLRSPKDNPPSDKPAGYRSIVRNIPGLHRKVVYVLGDLFPTIAFMKKRYGCSSGWKAALHYPHRIGKIVWLIRR